MDMERLVAEAVKKLARNRNARNAENLAALRADALLPNIDAWLRAHAIVYDRTWDLPRLIGATPKSDCIGPDTALSMGALLAVDICQRNIERLKDMIRRESILARSNHWTFDPPRYQQLHYVLAAERAIKIYLTRLMAAGQVSEQTRTPEAVS
jgi:hypothetical protein